METALGLLLLAATTINTSNTLPVAAKPLNTSPGAQEVNLTADRFLEKTTENVVLSVPFVHQIDGLPEDKKSLIGSTACGPTALTMVLNYLGKEVSLWEVIDAVPNSVYVKGRMFYKLDDGPKYFGHKAKSFKNSPKAIFEQLHMNRPVILNVQNYDGITGHAVVVVGILGFDGENAKSLIVHDPWKESYREFSYINSDTLKQPEGYILPIGILDPFVIQ